MKKKSKRMDRDVKEHLPLFVVIFMLYYSCPAFVLNAITVQTVFFFFFFLSFLKSLHTNTGAEAFIIY